MRYLLLILALALLVTSALWLTSCTQDIAEQDYYVEVDPGSIDPNCCGVTYVQVVSGVSPPGGQYYWLALLYHDTLVSYGEPVYVPEGPYQNINLRVSVSYLDEIPEGAYHREVFASQSLDGVGDIKRRTLIQSAGIAQVVSYADSICTICCTNESNGGLSKYIATANKDLGSAIGAKARIEARYGRLCGDILQSAQTGAWVGIRNDLPGSGASWTDWCQVGYMVRRLSASYVDTFTYFEANGFPGEYEWRFEGFADIRPVNGDTNEYVCEIDPGDGHMVYAFDADTVYDTLSAYWAGRSTRWASWEGEIDGRETDMPGTVSDPCEFLDCAYLLNDGTGFYNQANFGSTDKIFVTPQSGERPDEWGIWYDRGGSTIKIWDVNPLSP
jgi:hypothetical protein